MRVHEGAIDRPMSPVDFILGYGLRRPPPIALHAAKRSLLDLLGVWVAGSRTRLSRVIRDHAVEHFGGGAASCPLPLDGRTTGPLGATLAGGMTIDSLDAHDGYREAKGHAGCGLLPALLAVWRTAGGRQDGETLLALLVLGYEISCRTAVLQHARESAYHSSGSWIAPACAAVAGRLLEVDEERLRHALGIAEYHGPRAPMMRLIDHPTMLKDSSGWGAMAGVSAAYLAADGFTGAPAELIDPEHSGNASGDDPWNDLGRRWLIAEQYFKPWPVCRWAQPPIQALLDLRAAEGFAADDVASIEVETFHEAVRLAGARPRHTEEAQYALAFPLACALVHGTVLPQHIDGPGLSDPEVLAVAAKVRLREAADFQAAFPARRLARLRLILVDGRVLDSGPTEPRGDPGHPLSDSEVREKFRGYAGPVLGVEATRRLEQAVGDFAAPGFDAAAVMAILERPHRAGADSAAS